MGSSDRSRMYSTQLGQSSVEIPGLFEIIRRVARFRVFDTLSVKSDDLFRMCLVNLLVDFEEHVESCATSRLRPNIVS